MNAIIEVPFHGEPITVIETADGDYIALKPLVERFGLDWKSQHRKLTSASDLWRCGHMTIPSAGGEQEMTCLPLNRLAMWLASISVSKVRLEARERLMTYQIEAADVLDRHFRLRAREREEELAELRETNRRLRAMALAFNATANKIARLQEAGVMKWDMPAYIRRSREDTDYLVGTLEDAGVLRFEDWIGEKRWAGEWRQRRREAPIDTEAPTAVEALVEEMARAFPEA